MGPWRPAADNSLYYNPYAWTNLTSMVFLEQPVGVGFSYSTSPDPEPHSDIISALDNVAIIKAFFDRYPERRKNGFYFASESYGGHYVPQVTLLLFDEPSLVDIFRGYLVGNPFTGFGSGDIAMAHTVWGLQMVPSPAWDAFTANSCASFASDPYHYSSTCSQLSSLLTNVFPGNVNPYALTFPVCLPLAAASTSESSAFHRNKAQAQQLLRFRERRVELSAGDILEENKIGSFQKYMSARNLSREILRPIRERQLSSLSSTTRSIIPMLPDDETGPERISYHPCIESYAASYLKLPSVISALNVQTSPLPWSECSDPVFDHWPIADYYANTVASFGEIYRHPRRPADFKMLVYSGDADGVCATVGTQQWVFDVVTGSSSPSSLSLEALISDAVNGGDDQSDVVKQMWSPWMVAGQQAGYLTTFAQNFAFATVHTAGHEVPGYQPRRALVLLNMYLNGTAMFLSSSSFPAASSSSTSGSISSNSMEIAIWISLVIAAVALAAIAVFCRERIAQLCQRVDTSQYDPVAPGESGTTENPVLVESRRDNQSEGGANHSYGDDEGEEDVGFEFNVRDKYSAVASV